MKKTKSVDKKEKKVSKERPYYYGIGRRKTAIAKVRLFLESSNEILINDQSANDYFNSIYATPRLQEPMKIVGLEKKTSINAKIRGGGKNGQLDAVRLGISRAIIKLNPKFRTTLKKAGFLSRDPREKERKKPGLKGARRAPQWQKR